MTEKFESWRILIVSLDGDKILLKSTGTTFQLPQIEVPTGQRIAANITGGVQREFKLKVVSLYEIVLEDRTEPQNDFYHAAVSCFPPAVATAGMAWTALQNLKASSFLSKADAAAFKALCSKLSAAANNLTPEPFSNPHWFANATTWMQSSLQPHSLFLTGPFQQFNASSTFSLIRFETNGAPVWFKAVGTPNTREFSVTCALARVCPGHLPKMIASKPAWRAWLAQEAPGTSLATATGQHQWQSAASALAQLQICTLPHSKMMLEAGARDLRRNSLLELAAPFFEFARACQLEIAQLPQNRFCAVDIRVMQETVLENLRALESLHIPDTVGHMDLNPQNIFCSESGVIFLDWAEALVGCPLFSFEYLLQHFRRTHSSSVSVEQDFRESYMNEWRNRIARSDMETAEQAVPLVALFSYAATLWSDMRACCAPSSAQRRYFVQLLLKMSKECGMAKELRQ